MRDIRDVINSMLAQVPDEPEYEHLISSLEKILQSVPYSPPENRQLWWEELTYLVNDTMPPPESIKGWQLNFVNIFQNKA